MIVIAPLRIGYQDVPKIGSTSLFNYFYTCLSGSEYQPYRQQDGVMVYVHRYFRKGLYPDGVIVKNTPQAIAPHADCYRFTLTRDPIRRFISMYANRVLQKRETSPGSPYAGVLRKAGLPFDPDINYLVKHLEAYLDCHSSLHHHARPMMDYLGPDLSVYDRIADLSEIESVVSDIKAFWVQQGMTELADAAPALPRNQKSRANLGLEALTERSFEKLLDYYHADYAQLPTVSLSGVKAAYARATMGTAPVRPAAQRNLPVAAVGR